MRRSKSEYDEELDEPYLSGAYIRSFVKQLTNHPSSVMREKEGLEREGISMDAARKTHKKQVRRRLHTRKPYQEKLLNMAEARREIVTALKVHRAAMKQAAEKQKPGPDSRESRPGPNSYTCNNFPATFSDSSCVYYPPAFCHPYSWTVPPPPLGNLDLVLPTQALGLNLNLQDFIAAPSSIYSSSSAAASASTSSSPATGAPTPAAEQDEMRRSMEIRTEDEKEEEFVSSPFDEVMEFPTWLNANESWLQNVNDFCSFQDPALPCMDIEEIEGIDGDWLA